MSAVTDTHGGPAYIERTLIQDTPMLSTAAGKPIQLTETQQATRVTGKVVSRKIWLPKMLYDALPYFYLTSGFAAFFATMYISEWFWVLPHYLLFSAACVHLGVTVYRSRRNSKGPSSVAK